MTRVDGRRVNRAGTERVVEVVLRATIAHAGQLAEGDLMPHLWFKRKQRLRVTSGAKDTGFVDSILLNAVAVRGGHHAPAIRCGIHETVDPIGWYSFLAIEMLSSNPVSLPCRPFLEDVHPPVSELSLYKEYLG